MPRKEQPPAVLWQEVIRNSGIGEKNQCRNVTKASKSSKSFHPLTEKENNQQSSSFQYSLYESRDLVHVRKLCGRRISFTSDQKPDVKGDDGWLQEVA